MNVETILKGKGNAVVTIAPEASVGAAITLLRQKSIGALVVSHDGAAVLGILSERDIIHALADRGAAATATTVAELMSRHVVTCAPEDGIAELMAEMTERRIRHLPVIQAGRLAGIVSIGDVVKSRLDEVESEASDLRQFIATA